MQAATVRVQAATLRVRAATLRVQAATVRVRAATVRVRAAGCLLPDCRKSTFQDKEENSNLTGREIRFKGEFKRNYNLSEAQCELSKETADKIIFL